MHEMALCESILETLREQARLNDFTRVERVCLEI
ncbi:MAG: hydrogenase maturation nickel metallochaperone HypA, partial [Alphaproteobacteria bacterium]